MSHFWRNALVDKFSTLVGFQNSKQMWKKWNLKYGIVASAFKGNGQKPALLRGRTAANLAKLV